MPYMGQNPDLQNSIIREGSGTGDGTTVTFAMGFFIPSDVMVLVFLDGIKQDSSEYTIDANGSDCTFTIAPLNTVNIDFVGIDNLGLAIEPSDGTVSIPKMAGDIIDMVYPVGAIYMSTTNTSPQSLFGGTWTAIRSGRMLVSETGGVGYTAGNTGGSKDAVAVTHGHADTLYVPSGGSHTHPLQFLAVAHGEGEDSPNATGTEAGTSGTVRTMSTNHKATATSHSHPISGSVTDSGISGTDKNMPPYLAVYMWERAS